MRPILLRSVGLAVSFFGLLVMGLAGQAQANNPDAATGTIPPVAPVLQNSDFECTTGYYSQTNPAGDTIYVPNGWKLFINQGSPDTHSARINFAGSCEGSAHVERISGIDSILVEAQHLESSPQPGKPFDVTFYQQVSATVGGAYSLSGWQLSLCGGSKLPSDCPEGNYIAKMLGIDPTGGTDPLTDTVVWAENRRNFYESEEERGWVNLHLGAVAQAVTITIFARVSSPFQWHGNHAFIDAVSLVRAPTASLALPEAVTGTAMIVIWNGLQSPDVTGIPGGKYQLYVDLQYRHQEATRWSDLAEDQAGNGSLVFSARCTNTSYQFRVRARAEQPANQTGASPNQRYPGVWSDPVSVFFHALADEPVTPAGPNQTFLPLIVNTLQC